MPSVFRRASLKALVCAAGVVGFVGAAGAQETRIRFQLDWRFEGPAALFLAAQAKGYFKQEKLDVTIDPGTGSANTVNRVAGGTSDMGFADMAALMEFVGNNAAAPNKPVAVMMVYNNTPATVFALKKSGIRSVKDLAGRKLGAPVFDAGRKAWPIFAQANNIGNVTWVSMDPPLRETMLVRGEVDAITGFYFTSLLNLNARGAKDDEIVSFQYPQHGVRLYGNAVIVAPDFAKKNPEAVRGFLRALTRATRDVIADPDGHIRYVKQRDGLIDEKLELRRLKLAIESSIATPDARADGFGDVSKPRLALMASQVATAFNTKDRIDPDRIFDASYLPSKAERDIFRK